MSTKNEISAPNEVKKEFNAFFFKVFYSKKENRKYKTHIKINFSGWFLVALVVAIIIYCLIPNH